MSELLPCPFCGGAKIARSEYAPTKEITYFCASCKAGVTRARSANETAIAAWNRRAGATQAFVDFVARHSALCRRDALTDAEFRSVVEYHPVIRDALALTEPTGRDAPRPTGLKTPKNPPQPKDS